MPRNGFDLFPPAFKRPGRRGAATKGVSGVVAAGLDVLWIGALGMRYKFGQLRLFDPLLEIKPTNKDVNSVGITRED